MKLNARSARFLWGSGILLLALVSGCSGPTTFPVEGKITYKDATPLPGGGLVIFTPVDPDNKASPRGSLRADGTFRMGTYDDADGVPEGQYRVAIMPTPVLNLNKPPPGWPPLHKKYMNHATSELTFTVTRGKNECHFEVEK